MTQYLGLHVILGRSVCKLDEKSKRVCHLSWQRFSLVIGVLLKAVMNHDERCNGLLEFSTVGNYLILLGMGKHASPATCMADCDDRGREKIRESKRFFSSQA